MSDMQYVSIYLCCIATHTCSSCCCFRYSRHGLIHWNVKVEDKNDFDVYNMWTLQILMAVCLRSHNNLLYMPEESVNEDQYRKV